MTGTSRKSAAMATSPERGSPPAQFAEKPAALRAQDRKAADRANTLSRCVSLGFATSPWSEWPYDSGTRRSPVTESRRLYAHGEAACPDCHEDCGLVYSTTKWVE